MRSLITYLYRVLFFIAVLCLNFLVAYGSFILCVKYNFNFMSYYFDHFISHEHWGLIIGIPVLFFKTLLNYADKQAIFIYKNYVERIVYLRFFLSAFLFQFIIMICITVGFWKFCDVFKINLLKQYFDKPLSVEHQLTAFFMTLSGFKPLIKQSKKLTQKLFFKYYETDGRLITTQTKAYVYRRDRGKCKQCSSRRKLEYDHIKPHAKGGSNRAFNIQLLCMTCNRKKSDRY